jgi:hypothetical protein
MQLNKSQNQNHSFISKLTPQTIGPGCCLHPDILRAHNIMVITKCVNRKRQLHISVWLILVLRQPGVQSQFTWAFQKNGGSGWHIILMKYRKAEVEVPKVLCYLPFWGSHRWGKGSLMMRLREELDTSDFSCI